MPHPGRKSLAPLLAGLFLFASGCGLFSTRDPEPPSGPSGGENLAQTAREALSLLQNGVSLRDPDLYLNGISTGYRFIPAPGYAASFGEWTFNQERNFISSLLSLSRLPADSSAELSFELLLEEDYVDSARLRERYTLEVHTTDPALPEIYTGIADFLLVRERDGGWRVARWEDEETFDSPSTTQLRLAL